VKRAVIALVVACHHEPSPAPVLVDAGITATPSVSADVSVVPSPGLAIVSVKSDLSIDGEALGTIPPPDDAAFFPLMGRLTSALKAKGAKRARIEIEATAPYRLLAAIGTASSNARLDAATVVAGSRQLEIHFALTSRNHAVVFSSELEIAPSGSVLRFGEKRVAPGCRSATRDKTLPTVVGSDREALAACVAAMRATTEPMLWKEGTDLIAHATGAMAVGDVLDTITAAQGPDGTSYPSVILGL
jgi:hypothetical protein